MPISKDLWETIRNHLAGTYPSVEFRLGEDKISITREPKSESQTILCVYINGLIKASWMQLESDKPACVEKVWKTRQFAIFKAKDIRRIEKTFGKREAKKIYPNLHGRGTYFSPYFTKSSVLVRQFQKIKELELVSINHDSYEDFMKYA
ncbi:hypothetical protein L1286_00575 [Pseudoalteromonas sp. SMS1]|uniref:hypothetical protein n=1 Tax=Pseudoalteromonas sp. SMS1 TaxID=2908894 RepID=UPI001F23119F|nr:hypothetical protein [Pseudoalteromonas sp. SMS1]MCF2855950.1 hypothetical protein [Pseudoalteromonas sp. SMS1]